MSKFIKGIDRAQLEVFCLEESIDQDKEMRLIDLFRFKRLSNALLSLFKRSKTNLTSTHKFCFLKVQWNLERGFDLFLEARLRFLDMCPDLSVLAPKTRGLMLAAILQNDLYNK